MTYQLKRLDAGVYKKFSGVVTANEYMVSSTEVAEMPDYADLKFSVNDFSDIEGFRATPLDVANCAAMDLGVRHLNTDIQLAIISSDPALISLVKSMYQRATQYKIDYFASLADAEISLSRTMGKPVLLGLT